MASEQPGDESRRPPPLGLRGLSRVAFQARSSPTSSRLPPLGLAGRATLPSFSIGSATREPVSQPMAEAARPPRPAPTRRVGLSRPNRPPPAPEQAGPSNWASSPSQTGSDGDARSTYVGFNIFNGGGGISFGGGDFSMGGMSSAGGIRIGQSSSMFGGTSTTTGLGGENNAADEGYRGPGYNPNFDHADEYPPSQEFVQAPPRKEIDLNALANKQKRKQYDTNDKRHIYSMLLARNGENARLKKGVLDSVARDAKCNRREKGTWEVKPSPSVDREKSREYKVKYVLPAIKEKWPEKDRWSTVYIQQDNARTHVKADDPIFAFEAARGGWDIRLVNQPPNSPDCNILDLGWFASIQSMFHRKMPKTLPEIIQKVQESLDEYPHQKLNRIWLSHQACMREIIKHKGGQHYALPHLKKKTLEREGKLLVRLKVDKDYVEAAIEYLNGP
ncbi:hypothetical protein ACQ4PT_070493 [Festuca glaucescens]